MTKEFFISGFRGRLFSQAPLAPRTTWRMGGVARWLVQPLDLPDLYHLVTRWPAGVPRLLLGGGSNLLIDDAGFSGIVIDLSAHFNKITLEESSNGISKTLQVGAGVSTRHLAHQARHLGLTGTEFLSGIPGTFGGAIWMNAGAYGHEMKDILQEVDLMDPEGGMHTLPVEQLGMSYRQTKIDPNWFVIGGKIRLRPDHPPAILARMRHLNRLRAQSQPLRYPSAGSTFRNPPTGPKAWQLIDAAGLRGYRYGDAQVSEKHSNFLINCGQAKTADMLELIDQVQKKVALTSGIHLQLEVCFVPAHGLPKERTR
ncbi:MAG: UDP-N-acetylmuramate dehydrogenase [Magnetococcus sp. DMHC-6]